MRRKRPAPLCRSWLFLEGANEQVLHAAPMSGADVLIHELEDFTPPALRPRARELAVDLYASWREAGAVVAVRVNPLEHDGMDDLAAVMRGRPDIVALPKVAEPFHIARLDEAVTRFERDYGIGEGATALLFLVECVAAGVVAVDCPYTWSDLEGVERDTRWARRLGYGARSLVDPAHAAVVNRLLTPDGEELRQAQRIVAAFETARARGDARVELDGSLLEVPTYSNAKRLLARWDALRAFE
jgi:citrate lyase subunit beta/citryl-CoA lyase